jgi:AcrR family transcriptional regulator
MVSPCWRRMAKVRPPAVFQVRSRHEVFGFGSMKTQHATTEKRRRRPVQSRSWQTSLAIQDAFVRLLDGSPYENVTIRDIVLVAGVGLGTFYEYFDDKEDLARVCVHMRTKRIVQALIRCRKTMAGRSLAESVSAAIESQATIHAQAPREWRQHFLLERLKTDPEFYRTAYELCVLEWRRLIVTSADWPAGLAPDEPARLVFTLVYGGLSHEALRAGDTPDFAAASRRLQRAAMAVLDDMAASSRAPVG